MWVLSLSLLSNGLCYYSSGCPTCPRHCCYCCWSKHNKAVSQTSSLQPSRLPGLVWCVGSRLRGCRFLEYRAAPSLLLGAPTETHHNLANGVCKCLMRTSGVGEGWQTGANYTWKKKRLSNLDTHMNFSPGLLDETESYFWLFSFWSRNQMLFILNPVKIYIYLFSFLFFFFLAVSIHLSFHHA